MKKTFLASLVCTSAFFDVTLFAISARGQDVATRGRLQETATAAKATTQSVVAAAGPSVSLSKSALVSGHRVCGVIRITNSSGQPVSVVTIADSLEVHFARGTPLAALPPGSTSNWFKVADVPIANPGSIQPRTTANVEYCHSLCLAEDFAGANSMRNVVSVTVAGASGATRTFTTRSTSFPPPTLDCRACCMPDGSCIDTVPADCAAAGGRTQAAATDCATTECPQACCHADDTCSDEPPSVCQNSGDEPKGPGSECASTQCCEPLGAVCANFSDCCDDARCLDDTCCLERGDTGCTERSHCCEEDGTALCEDGKCCAPNRAPDSCHDTGDCCDANATCSAGTCCISLGDTGCTNLVGNDCCQTFGAVTCQDGKCCAPTGADESCGADTDCCNPNATCVLDGNDPGTCCIPVGNTGCDDFSDCCEDNFESVICRDGKCCGPSGSDDSCHDDVDCCDYPAATCNGRTCCVRLGQTGCGTSHSACCRTFGTAICDSDKCCAPIGSGQSCGADTDCCDPNATCVLDGNDPGTCCIAVGATGCEDSLDCCDDGSGSVTCNGGKCCAPNGVFSSCSADTDCCNETETCNSGGVCCVALGNSGCSSFSRCCDTPGISVFCDAAGRCCGSTGIPSSCDDDTDCCESTATCNGGTCCVRLGASGCDSVSDCCDDRPGVTCTGEKCCVRTDADTTSACIADTDCCEANAICNIHRACCLPTGTTGCFSSSQCCDSGANCVSGKCCAPNGGPGTCTDSTDCCNSNAVCNLNHVCCVPDFRSCGTNSDCCSGLCVGGLCESVIDPG